MAARDHCDLLCLDLPIAEELRRTRISAEQAARAAALASAVADPTRFQIAAALVDAEELCVCDLSWIVERPQALVSHHVRLLRDRKIVSSRRDGKMMLYSLTDEGRELLASVLAVEVSARG